MPGCMSNPRLTQRFDAQRMTYARHWAIMHHSQGSSQPKRRLEILFRSGELPDAQVQAWVAACKASATGGAGGVISQDDVQVAESLQTGKA